MSSYLITDVSLAVANNVKKQKIEIVRTRKRENTEPLPIASAKKSRNNQANFQSSVEPFEIEVSDLPRVTIPEPVRVASNQPVSHQPIHECSKEKEVKVHCSVSLEQPQVLNAGIIDSLFQDRITSEQIYSKNRDDQNNSYHAMTLNIIQFIMKSVTAYSFFFTACSFMVVLFGISCLFFCGMVVFLAFYLKDFAFKV
jgi:hypothetical protein